MDATVLSFPINGLGGGRLSDDRHRLAVARGKAGVVLYDRFVLGEAPGAGRDLVTEPLKGRLDLSPSGELLSTPDEYGVSIWTWKGKKRCAIADAADAMFLDDDRVIALRQTLRDPPGAAYTFTTVGENVQLSRIPESPEVKSARDAAIVEIVVVDVREGSAGAVLRSEPFPGGVDHRYDLLRRVTSSGVYLNETCSNGREWTHRIVPESLDIYSRSGAGVFSASHSSSLLVMTLGSRLVFIDDQGRELCQITDGEACPEEDRLEPYEAVLVDDENLVVRTVDRKFVHIRRRGAECRSEDISERVHLASGLAEKPRVSIEVNRSVVAIMYPKHTVIVDLRDLALA